VGPDGDSADGAPTVSLTHERSAFRSSAEADAPASVPGEADDRGAVAVGCERTQLFVQGDRLAGSPRSPVLDGGRIPFDGVRLRIGRDQGNDLVLDDPNVSAFHAEVVAAGDGLEIRDLGSRNGTRLNGELVNREMILAGANIGVGSLRLVFDGTGFLGRDDYGEVRLDAEKITVRVPGKRILDRASFSLGPGELVAIIGESGAGKTTLLKALAGVTQPDSGRVLANGEPIASRLTDVGYVPQQEIDHSALSIREGLTYAARLRLPDDASEEEISRRVRDVLEELALDEHSETRIGSISGGQRRRANVATELLGRPSLLLLDEPTTGMDPWLESKMMKVFRGLAKHSRGVALVTHATKSLALCDRVVVIAPGGLLVFDGSPADACSFFKVDDFDSIYPALAETSPTQWRERFEESSSDARLAPIPEPGEPVARNRRRRAGRRRVSRQARILTSRYAKLLSRDRRNLLLLLLLPLVFAVSGVGLFRAGAFDRPGGDPGDTIQALYLAVVVMNFLGTIAAVLEIIKERGVFQRETALGVRPAAYLVSKLLVLFSLIVLQATLYSVVLFTFRPLQVSMSIYLEVYALLIATGFVSTAVGLLISAAVRTERQAITALPLAIVPTLLFTGTIVPVARMAAPAHALAAVTFGRWSLAAIGAAVHMNARMAETPGFAEITHLGTHFFTTGFPAGMLIQGTFLVAILAATTALLRR
jgi:ABC-type multidrug transport system ATPase subunit